MVSYDLAGFRLAMVGNRIVPVEWAALTPADVMNVFLRLLPRGTAEQWVMVGKLLLSLEGGRQAAESAFLLAQETKPGLATTMAVDAARRNVTPARSRLCKALGWSFDGVPPAYVKKTTTVLAPAPPPRPGTTAVRATPGVAGRWTRHSDYRLVPAYLSEQAGQDITAPDQPPEKGPAPSEIVTRLKAAGTDRKAAYLAVGQYLAIAEQLLDGKEKNARLSGLLLARTVCQEAVDSLKDSALAVGVAEFVLLPNLSIAFSDPAEYPSQESILNVTTAACLFAKDFNRYVASMELQVSRSGNRTAAETVRYQLAQVLSTSLGDHQRALFLLKQIENQDPKSGPRILRELVEDRLDKQLFEKALSAGAASRPD